MSRRTIKLIDLLCKAGNWQHSIDGAKEDVERYQSYHPWKTEAEDEVHRWSKKRDKIIAKLRLLLDRLDEHEQRHLIKYSNPDLDVLMREIGIELPWWVNRAAQAS